MVYSVFKFMNEVLLNYTQHSTFSCFKMFELLLYQVCYMHHYVTESGEDLIDYGCMSPQVFLTDNL